MSRIRRLVLPGVPHHVTQRGNRRQDIFLDDEDYGTYWELCRLFARRAEVEILAYCLMPNHTHLLPVPLTERSLCKMFHPLHTTYAQYFNKKYGHSGHLFQGRFFSCALDYEHLRRALWYVELNPVRAKLAETPEQYEWASAKAHCGLAPDYLLTKNKKWLEELLQINEWRVFLARGQTNEHCKAIREATARNLPCMERENITKLEAELKKDLRIRKRGRPEQIVVEDEPLASAIPDFLLAPTS